MTSVKAFLVDVIPELFSIQIDLASNFLLHSLILKVVLPDLIAAEASRTRGQLLMADELRVHRSEGCPKTASDCSDAERSESSERHYLLHFTVFYLF